MSNADSDIPMQRMLITIEYDGTGLVAGKDRIMAHLCKPILKPPQKS